MKIIGQFKAILRDKDTGEITKIVEGTNHIQDWWLLGLITVGTPTGTQRPGSELFISEYNPGKQRRDWPATIPDVGKGGLPIAGITSPDRQYDYDDETQLCQFVRRFDAPAADYTINMAGLCSSVSGTTGDINSAVGVVWLETPCVQTTTETLDLYYRLQVKFNPDWKTQAADGYLLTRYDAYILAYYMFKSNSTYLLPNTSVAGIAQFPKLNARKMDIANFFITPFPACEATTVTHTSTGSTKYYRKDHEVVFDIEDFIGGLVSHVFLQSGSLGFKLLTNGESPLQSVFGHRSTSVTPFYDAATSQTGLGAVNINGDAWTNPDFPKWVKVKITTAGNIGVGAYKLEQRNHFGFNLNTFQNQPAAMPSTVWRNAHYTGGFQIGRGSAGADALDIVEKTAAAFPVNYNGHEQILWLWNDEFAISTVQSGEGFTFNNLSLVGIDLIPRFLATDIGQVAVASDLSLYIGCRNTGLYKFNPAFDTLTVIDGSTPGLTGATGCYAITIGNGGRLWGYFDGTTPGLYYSDDTGANWVNSGFSDTAIDAEPQLVAAVQADPNDAVGKLAIVYADTISKAASHIMTIKWWNQNTTTVTDGPVCWAITYNSYAYSPMSYQDHSYYINNILRCSPNNSYWASAARKVTTASEQHPAFFTFETTTVENMDSANDLGSRTITTNFAPDAAGDDALLYISGPSETNSTTQYGSHIVLFSRNLTFENCGYNGGSNAYTKGDRCCLYLGESVWLFVYNHTSLIHNADNMTQFLLMSCQSEDATEWETLPGLKAETFPEYGWNGSSWEKGHAGEKPLHATTEELLDGVTINFDDNSGSTPFLDTDFYTFGLFDGIWMDGSTSFEFMRHLYLKPTAVNTEVESSTLPVVQKVPNTIIAFQTDQVADYQDLQSTDTNNSMGEIQGTGTASQSDYNAGGRSLNPSVIGDALSYLPNNTYIPDTDINNAQGWIDFTIDMNASFHLEAYMGLSDATVLGTTLDYDTIQYAIHVDSVTPGNGVGTCTARVVEGGIERASVADLSYSNNSNLHFKIALLTNGSMSYMYKEDLAEALWIHIYTTPPGTVTIQHYYMDFNYVPASNYGFVDVQSNYLDTSNPDYYMYLGNGVDIGLFAPEFYAIDPITLTVWIDGVEAVNIGEDDSVTVLSTNSYSIYPLNGTIRFSASDAGLSVTAEYTTITHE